MRGLLHGSAAIACAWLAGLVETTVPAGPEKITLLVCALSQSALFTASALYHSVPWTPAWKVRMQRTDHSMIFVKIAGTLTPLFWLGLDGAERTAMIALAWGITLFGVAYTFAAREFDHPAPMVLKLAQGCLAIPALGPFTDRMGGAAGELLAFAVVCYGLGCVVFVTQRPVLLRRSFSFHELFHLLVVAGSASFLLAVTSALPAA